MAAGAWSWQPYRHLWAECLESVGASTFHNALDLYGVLQGQVAKNVSSAGMMQFQTGVIYVVQNSQLQHLVP
jgi:hypothetical protein